MDNFEKKSLDKQFKNPILAVNIASGEGFNKIKEIWQKENHKTYPSMDLIPNESVERLVKTVNKKFTKLDKIDEDIIAEIKRISVDGITPFTTDHKNLYNRARQRRGWDYYCKKAGVKRRKRGRKETMGDEMMP